MTFAPPLPDIGRVDCFGVHIGGVGVGDEEFVGSDELAELLNMLVVVLVGLEDLVVPPYIGWHRL